MAREKLAADRGTHRAEERPRSARRGGPSGRMGQSRRPTTSDAAAECFRTWCATRSSVGNWVTTRSRRSSGPRRRSPSLSTGGACRTRGRSNISYVGTWKRADGRRYVAFFGCLYYAMMRPEEVIALKEEDCELPESGFGLIVLHKATPYAGRRWTDKRRASRRQGAQGPR
jgi:hypothetical protein